jgi:uncharacterized protein with HEPN domain
MPHDEDINRLCHIWQAACEIQEHTKFRTKKQFLSDRLLQLAIVRLVEMIGEAASRISDEYKDQHRYIDWRAMVTMRNRLVHVYFDIDLDVVWQTIAEDIPALMNVIKPILQKANML